MQSLLLDVGAVICWHNQQAVYPSVQRLNVVVLARYLHLISARGHADIRLYSLHHLLKQVSEFLL